MFKQIKSPSQKAKSLMRKWWFSVHKWVGLIVGLQVLAWTVSGVYMTWVPIETVRSEHNIKEQPPRDLRLAKDLVSPQRALEAIKVPVSRIELIDIAGRWMWRVDSGGHPHLLIDAEGGKVVSPLDEAAAKRIAKADFKGAADITTATLISKDPPLEYKGHLPAWQMTFADEGNTRLYVDALTGKVAARRSDVWRTYDFLWSLHIMDYSEHEDFNHWPLIIMSVMALVLTISGIGLLVIRLWPLRTSFTKNQ